MKRRWLAVSIVIAVAVTACKKSPAPGPGTPAPTAPMPAEVFAILTVPAPRATVDSLGKYADAIEPGELAELTAGAEEHAARLAIDDTKPLHVVLLTPPADDDDPVTVIVAATRDPAAALRARSADELIRGAHGWLVIAEPDQEAAADRVLTWATTTLVAAPAPKRMTGVLFPAAVRARWEAELRADLDDAPAAFRDALLALVEQTDKVEVFAEIDPRDLVAEIVLTPRAGTTLASLVEAQRPSSFRLLERLPLEQPLGAMAGHLALGDFSRQLEDLAIAFIGAELAATSPELNQRLIALVEALFDLGTGEYAGVTDIATSAVVNALGVSDAARVGVAIDRVVDAARRLPMPPGVQLDVQRSTHAGVALNVGTLFAGNMAAASGSWAAWDGTVAFTLTDPEGELLRATVDGTRKPPAVAPDVARALADARARGDSLLTLFDVLPGDQYPIAVSLGVRTGSAYLWARVPAAQAAALALFRARDNDDD